MRSKRNTDPVVSAYKAIELPLVKNEALARELNVISQARRAARRQVPELSAAIPDANEVNYRQRIEARALEAVNRVTRATEPLRQRLPMLNISQEVTEIEELHDEFERTLAAELAPDLSELDSQRQRLAQAEEEQKVFKQQHQLERSADYPASHWLSLAVLSTALLIETLLNGTLLAQGSDFGLLGGASNALLIALLNVGLGFVAGWWILRYKNHARRGLARSMLGIFVLLALVALSFNYLVAHYREVLLISPDNAWAVLEARLLAGEWLVGDFESWLLFLIGMFFYCLAVYKGYQFDDEYPGYGRIDRVRERHLDLLLEGRESTINRLEQLHEATDSRLSERFRQIQEKKQQLFSTLGSLEYQHELLLAYLRHLHKALLYVIRLYRETNTSERNGACPAYFQQTPAALDTELPPSCQPENQTYSDPQYRLTTEKTVHRLGQALPQIRSQLLTVKEHYHHKIDEACQL